MSPTAAIAAMLPLPSPSTADADTGAGVPLLPSSDPPPTSEGDNSESDLVLDDALRGLHLFLSLLGFHHSASPLAFFLSASAFLALAVLAPALVLRLRPSKDRQVADFELYTFSSHASLAAASLFCVTHNLRKHGLRKFLFVDRFHGQATKFCEEYVAKLKGFFHLLLRCVAPVLLLKIIRESVRLVYVSHDSWILSIAIWIALVVSWTYCAIIFLSACILFSLVCNLQIIHFDDYGKLLEGECDALMLLEEHMRLRHHLSKISHRFRIFLLLAFLVVTASQFVTLFQTTGYHGVINLINGGDFAVCSIVEVVGLTLCLHSAAKISHRAQSVAGLASRWHAMLTCSWDRSQLRATNSEGNFEAATDFFPDYSESDLESLDIISRPGNSISTFYLSSFQRRQALVTYLQCNPGGLTIFGWTVDRALINTIFFIEMSLVLFVLGKTAAFTSK